MNRNDFLEKYKGVKFKFVEYYKHRFQYTTKVEGDIITVWLGDKDGDIYRNYFEPFEKILDCTLLCWRINEGEVEE